MRTLTTQEIENIVTRNPNAKRISVESFLATMGDRKDGAMINLRNNVKFNKWTMATVRAITQGIKIACT